MCKPRVLCCLLSNHAYTHTKRKAYVNKCRANTHYLKRPTITHIKVTSLTYFISYYIYTHPVLCSSIITSSVILSTAIASHVEPFLSTPPPFHPTPLKHVAKIGSKTACHFWSDPADTETITWSDPVKVSSWPDSYKNKHWFPFIQSRGHLSSFLLCLSLRWDQHINGCHRALLCLRNVLQHFFFTGERHCHVL